MDSGIYESAEETAKREEVLRRLDKVFHLFPIFCYILNVSQSCFLRSDITYGKHLIYELIVAHSTNISCSKYGFMMIYYNLSVQKK